MYLILLLTIIIFQVAVELLGVRIVAMDGGMRDFYQSKPDISFLGKLIILGRGDGGL